jgi:hypothetical protein
MHMCVCRDELNAYAELMEIMTGTALASPSIKVPKPVPLPTPAEDSVPSNRVRTGVIAKPASTLGRKQLVRIDTLQAASLQTNIPLGRQCMLFHSIQCNHHLVCVASPICRQNTRNPIPGLFVEISGADPAQMTRSSVQVQEMMEPTSPPPPVSARDTNMGIHGTMATHLLHLAADSHQSGTLLRNYQRYHGRSRSVSDGFASSSSHHRDDE